MDSNIYVGIPFVAGGRDNTGTDCWGLVRLYYSRELGIDLPSFSDSYNIDDNSRIEELIAQYKEGWEPVEVPTAGDVVVFNIFGEPIHLGVMIDGERFLHTRENRDSVIDVLGSTRWQHRVEGFYRYNPKTGIILNAVPHPLKTVSVTSWVVAGTNLEELYAKVNLENGVTPELSKTAVIMVNGVPVPRTQWGVTALKATDTVEYRAVAGKEVVKLVALIAIAYFAPQLILEYGAGTFLTTTTATGATALSFAGTVASATLVIAGSALINAIAPVRPPSSEDPGSSAQQNLISGNNNPYNPYGAIPVVLGKIRYNPPLGAKSFVTYPNYNDSYLNMMLVWGYGPLTIDEATMRVGDVPLADYELAPGTIGKKTLDRKTVVSTTDQDIFDSIYGNDVDQFFKGIDMTGPDYDPNAVGDSTELPSYVRPLDTNSQAIQNLLFNTYSGQPIWPLPGPLPDDIYDQQPT